MKRWINLISHSHDITKKENTELCNEQTQISQKVVSNMGKNKVTVSMKDENYIRGKRGIALISEAFTCF